MSPFSTSICCTVKVSSLPEVLSSGFFWRNPHPLRHNENIRNTRIILFMALSFPCRSSGSTVHFWILYNRYSHFSTESSWTFCQVWKNRATGFSITNTFPCKTRLSRRMKFLYNKVNSRARTGTKFHAPVCGPSQGAYGHRLQLMYLLAPEYWFLWNRSLRYCHSHTGHIQEIILNTGIHEHSIWNKATGTEPDNRRNYNE